MAKAPANNAAQRVARRSARTLPTASLTCTHHSITPSSPSRIVKAMRCRGLRRWSRLQGFAQVHAVRCPGGIWKWLVVLPWNRASEPRCRNQGSWTRSRVVGSCLGCAGHSHQHDCRCDSSSTQRLPPAKAPSYLILSTKPTAVCYRWRLPMFYTEDDIKEVQVARYLGPKAKLSAAKAPTCF